MSKPSKVPPPAEKPEYPEEPEEPEEGDELDDMVNSPYVWEYQEGPIPVNMVAVTATDGVIIIASDAIGCDITVDIQKVGDTIAPAEASILDPASRRYYTFKVGQSSPAEAWTAFEEEHPGGSPLHPSVPRVVGSITINFKVNDSMFENAGWTKESKKKLKTEEVESLHLTLRTQHKTDLFREDIEHVVVIIGDTNNELDALNAPHWSTGMSKTTVGTRKIFRFTETDSDIRGMEIQGWDANKQSYSGFIEGAEEMTKEAATKMREEHRKSREEKAWDELVPVGFPQKYNGSVEYIFIDEKGELKKTRIVPAKGGM